MNTKAMHSIHASEMRFLFDACIYSSKIIINILIYVNKII
jgi:hypothetical protein